MRARLEREKKFARKLSRSMLGERFNRKALLQSATTNTQTFSRPPSLSKNAPEFSSPSECSELEGWERWSSEDMGDWLASHGGKAYRKVATALMENHIDGSMLSSMDSEGLDWVGTP